MSAYQGPIFDCDTHLIEVGDAWSRYLPEKFVADWGYEWKVGPDGEFALYVGKRKIQQIAGYYTEDGKVAAPGMLHEWLRAMKDGKETIDIFVQQTPDMYNREARIEKLDEFGVEGAIIFIGNMVATMGYLDEVEPANAIFHAYNQYLNDDWGFDYKDRIYATPMLNLFDLEASCREAEWVVARGARVVLMPMGPTDGRSPADPYYDRFWSILNEAKVNVAFHVGEATHMHDYMHSWGEKPMQTRTKQSAFTWMNFYSERPVVETLSSFIFYNFFARFPNIKLMSAENGSEWVPAMLTKMDKSRGLAKGGFWPCGQLKDRPSRIFKENVTVVAYPEDDLENLVQQTGGDYQFLVMGSDYPHPEGVKVPRAFADEACSGLSDVATRAIMYDNGRAFLPKAA